MQSTSRKRFPHGMNCGQAVVAILLVLAATPARAAGGRLDGRVLDQGVVGVEGATVKLVELGLTRQTDAEGRYLFAEIDPGTYTLEISLAIFSHREEVEVESVGTTQIVSEVDWGLNFAETITVAAPSRTPQRLVEAPAAVSSIGAQEIEQQSTTGQVPLLVSSTPGIELPQSGLYDFNLNSRGFNDFTNASVLTLIDGREPSLPGVGSEDWAAISFPLDDLDDVEMVRGPGSALYGAGAFNGVLNMTTRAPRDHLGGRLRLTAGELDTRRIDLLHAMKLGGDWYLKLTGGYQESDDFVVSRVDGGEYEPDLLPPDVIPPPLDKVEIAFGGVRLDKYFGEGARVMTLEAGTARHEGTVTLSGLGRSQQPDVRRPWARFNLNAQHWNVLAYYTGQDTRALQSLNAGAPLYLDTSRLKVEAQGNTTFAGGKGRLIGGASIAQDRQDSADPNGVQTLFDDPKDADSYALFGQVDYDLTQRLKGVFSIRWDENDLFDTQISPRGALVFALNPRHTLRATYGEAFRNPSFSALFIAAPVAPPVDLSALEEALSPLLGGVPLGFESVPLLALGNANLTPVQVRSTEIGYNAILGSRWFFNASLYYNELENFVSNLLPNVGTSLGRLNPDYGPYRPPSELSPAASAAVLAGLGAALPPELLASMSNAPDGNPIFALLSLTNFGRVEVQGLELGMNVYLGTQWRLELNYDYFDWGVNDAPEELALSPNRADNQLGLAAFYFADDWDASFKYRWVDDFVWASGLFIGPVPSYGVADLSFDYRFSKRWRTGLEVTNLFDNEHWEVFGGTVIGRRALVHLDIGW